MQARLKQQALTRLEVLVQESAGRISNALEPLDARKVAASLPDVMDFLSTLRDELCKENLRKRLSQHLLAAVPTQKLGRGAAKTSARGCG